MRYEQIDNNFKFVVKTHMEKILEPLAAVSSIRCFRYHKIFNDGNRINLTTHPEATDAVYSNEKFLHSGLCLPGDRYEPGYYLTSASTNNFALNLVSEFYKLKYQMGHGCYIIKKTKDYCEIFHFLAKIDSPEITNFYITNKDFLEKFIFFFRNQSAQILKIAEQNKFDFLHIKLNTTDLDNPFFIKENINNLKQNLQQKLCMLLNPKGNVTLTGKEIECLKFLTKGYKIKTIAQELNISPRTIKSHVDHLKEKFECYSISSLCVLSNKYLFPLLID